jgi:hypothetical protein
MQVVGAVYRFNGKENNKGTRKGAFIFNGSMID